jgi:hypothetical protein
MKPRTAVPASRRQFLADAAAAGAACLAANRSTHAAEPKPWTMRLATSSIHYMHLPIEGACEQIARLGFEAIDIWSAHAGCPHLDDVQKRLGPDGLKKLLARQKLDLFAFSTYRGGYKRYAELLGKAGACGRRG